MQSRRLQHRILVFVAECPAFLPAAHPAFSRAPLAPLATRAPRLLGLRPTALFPAFLLAVAFAVTFAAAAYFLAVAALSESETASA